MKKSLGLLVLTLGLLSSCTTLTKTARTASTTTSLQSATVADLKVADERITYTMAPSKEIRRGGLSNIKQAAEQEALTKNGNADVLLEPQYVISKRKGLFGSKVTSITVSGRPAYYTNFRALDDSVWSNPVFRGIKTVSYPKAESRHKVKKQAASGYRGKGFAKYVTIAGLHGTTECDFGYDSDDSECLWASALFSVGYQFNPYVYFGAGAGALFYEDAEDMFVPLFGHLRFNLSKKRNTIFIDTKIGYSPVTIDDSFEGDMFGAFSIGYSFGNFDIAWQTTFQTFYGESSRSYKNEADYEASCVGLSLGFRF